MTGFAYSATAARKRACALLIACIFAVAMCAVVAVPDAHAQQVVLLVNGDPITTYDIDQRGKFMLMSSRKAPTRAQVIEDLINDKLKIQIGKRYKLEVSDDEVEGMLGEMAKRMRNTTQQLIQVLQNGGVDVNTLRDRIRADYAWQQIVRGKYQSSLQVTDKDVSIALLGKNKDEKELTGTEYTLRPILFVVARGGGDAAVDVRKRDAEALRGRFDSCETGIPFARALRDVAVRDAITKTSADLPQALRDVLDKTPVGKLTEPEVTAAGVEVFALCGRRETKADSVAKREVQNELFAEQFASNAGKLLKSLRKAAMIEVKDSADAKDVGIDPR